MTLRRGPHPGVLACFLALGTGTILYLLAGDSPSSAEAEKPPPSDDGIGRQDYRGMTPPPELPTPITPSFEERVNGNGEKYVVQNFRGMSPDVKSTTPSVKPHVLPAGTLMLVSKEVIAAVVRNPEPVTNLYGKTYASGETCYLDQDIRLESLGNDGGDTLVRVKDFNEVSREEYDTTACPVGAVFFIPNEQAEEFVAYARGREQRQREEALKEQQERETVQRLLDEYNRKNR